MLDTGPTLAEQYELSLADAADHWPPLNEPTHRIEIQYPDGYLKVTGLGTRDRHDALVLAGQLLRNARESQTALTLWVIERHTGRAIRRWTVDP